MSVRWLAGVCRMAPGMGMGGGRYHATMYELSKAGFSQGLRHKQWPAILINALHQPIGWIVAGERDHFREPPAGFVVEGFVKVTIEGGGDADLDRRAGVEGNIGRDCDIFVLVVSEMQILTRSEVHHVHHCQAVELLYIQILLQQGLKRGQSGPQRRTLHDWQIDAPVARCTKHLTHQF